MHDIVHDLAMFISGEFCFELNDSNDLSYLPTKACHLSISTKGSNVSTKIMKVLTSQTRSLRTFLLLSQWYLLEKSLLHDLFLKVGGSLRVLSLSNLHQEMKLPDSIGNMKYLRYLDLSQTSIEELPDSICTLYNLETLLLSACGGLERLPTRLVALVNLRHLNIKATYRIKDMPLQMYKLKNLQTLSDFVLGENGGWKIKELGELPLLGGSLLISGLEYITDIKDVLEANLKDKKFLSQLILKWNEKSNITSSQQEREVLAALQPHTNLKQLRISGYIGTIFLDWVGHDSFCNMVLVDLHFCINVCRLPPLGQLYSLISVVIEGLDGVVSIGNEFCGSSSNTTNHPFTSLEYLSISHMASWDEWSFSSDQPS
ncbi:hypothetical protein UlMin_003972 [Ulmus minor]